LSQRSWTEALALAQKLGEAGWANRARAEIGLAAFLQGDTNTAIVNIGQSLKVAELTRDVSSVVRWLTLFGHGYMQLGRAEQAVDFYERALKLARTVPEIAFPVMTYLGKGDALIKLGRVDGAETQIRDALSEATREGSAGYQSELTMRLALIAESRKQIPQALQLMARAMQLARSTGTKLLVANLAMEHARALRAAGQLSEAETALVEGVAASRETGERLVLPRLLAQLADLPLSMNRRARAAELLREADDLLEGLLTNASSPWVRGRILAAMDDVVAARIRLEGEQASKNPAGLFAVVERARGRSLLDLLHARPLSQIQKPEDLRAGERHIATLQLRLLRTKSQVERGRLLDDIFIAEERLAPLTTELFTQAGRSPRGAVSLSRVQAALRPDELLLEYALAEPTSFVVVITSKTTRVARLPGRGAIAALATKATRAARAGLDSTALQSELAAGLLPGLHELSTRRRLVVSVEGALQQVPFELLPFGTSRLLDTHVVSYTQSAAILVMLRSRSASAGTTRVALGVGSSPASPGDGAAGPTTRGVYDMDVSKLPALPLATEEARFVGAVFGERDSTSLVGPGATEGAFKRQRLADFRVVHLAAHGIISTKMPARSALLLQPSDGEDGFLQAREILELRLNSVLVTLSACDTSAGAEHGQDGVASLVRPFVAAGARAVVANLWAVDDTFSSALMREFYRELANGVDIGEALRRAKLALITKFGAAATPQLWSGVLAFGDTAQSIVRRPSATAP
jgi:CHAT domain-containing protein/Tfp pilus assembly protein PilF